MYLIEYRRKVFGAWMTWAHRDTLLLAEAELAGTVRTAIRLSGRYEFRIAYRPLGGKTVCIRQEGR